MQLQGADVSNRITPESLNQVKINSTKEAQCEKKSDGIESPVGCGFKRTKESCSDENLRPNYKIGKNIQGSQEAKDIKSS